MTKNMYLTSEAKAWVKRKNGPDEIVRVLPDVEMTGTVRSYELYIAYDDNADYLGRILFDMQGYWIYDGNVFDVFEQEQLARFIINHADNI